LSSGSKWWALISNSNLVLYFPSCTLVTTTIPYIWTTWKFLNLCSMNFPQMIDVFSCDECENNYTLYQIIHPTILHIHPKKILDIWTKTRNQYLTIGKYYGICSLSWLQTSHLHLMASYHALFNGVLQQLVELRLTWLLNPIAKGLYRKKTQIWNLPPKQTLSIKVLGVSFYNLRFWVLECIFLCDFVNIVVLKF
jgi:hypothetical protein